MGKAQRFERRLQGMVGDAFARVFGGSVVPQEVAQALQREADDNARPLAGGRVLAPNRYTVTLGATDHDRLAGDAQRVIRMLAGAVRSHLAERAWDVYGDVVVTLKRSETLHTGQFRTSSSVDPDTPHPRTPEDRVPEDRVPEERVTGDRVPGDRAMSQQPGEHTGGAPDYGQPSGYDFPDSRYGHDPSARYAQDQHRQYGYAQGEGYHVGYPPYDDQRPEGTYEQSYGHYGGEQPDYGYGQEAYRPLSASLTLDDGSHRCHQLSQGATVVGRGQDAQFRLPDTGVSRRHLEIIWDGQTAVLSDLGSTNGTTVNGTPVQTWQLVDGDVVRVGQSRLVFRTQG